MIKRAWASGKKALSERTRKGVGLDPPRKKTSRSNGTGLIATRYVAYGHGQSFVVGSQLNRLNGIWCGHWRAIAIPFTRAGYALRMARAGGTGNRHRGATRKIRRAIGGIMTTKGLDFPRQGLCSTGKIPHDGRHMGPLGRTTAHDGLSHWIEGQEKISRIARDRTDFATRNFTAPRLAFAFELHHFPFVRSPHEHENENMRGSITRRETNT